jgi:signal transduction histidine kinase
MSLGTMFVAAAVGTSLGSAGLIRYLWQYRDRPGADWLLGTLACQTLWSGCYGVSLFVVAPSVRWALEIAMLGLLVGLSLFFFAFALEYTGRGRISGRTLRGSLALSPMTTAVLSATNPVHHLFWRGFRVEPVAGLVGVRYAFEPLALAFGTVGLVLPLVGSLLLFDTVVSYGPLYRREAVAVGLSTLPPTVGFVVWLYGLGPYPQLNFAAVGFLPHVALDAYAFLGNDMFEFDPATRRAGERAALDDLGTPVVVVDERGRVVTLNDAAEDALGVRKDTARTAPLEGFLDGGAIDPAVDAQRIPVDGTGGRRTYSVTSTSLDAGGDHLGYTLVWQDVTEELRREQGLGVLNRVLRHNLRNDMTVVRGLASTARERVDDDRIAEMLDATVDTADELVSLGETAREIERLLADDPRPESVDVRAVLSELITEASEAAPEATVELDGPSTRVAADATILRAVCAELLDNAIRHAGPEPTVAVTVDPGSAGDAGDGNGDPAVVRVADDGPGLPETELSVVRAGEETQLDHGSGLGLWLVRWGTERIGADVEFEMREDGTTVALSIPAE